MIRNVHERTVDATPEQVWPILCDIEKLWPEDMGSFRMPEGIHPGAPVHHMGLVYKVKTVEPGKELWFDMGTAMPEGHGFTLTATDQGTLVRHTIAGKPGLKLRLAWPVIRPKHDYVIEHILDGIQARVAQP